MGRSASRALEGSGYGFQQLLSISHGSKINPQEKIFARNFSDFGEGKIGLYEAIINGGSSGQTEAKTV
ncbi:Hypothetical protein NTJ_10117 [Nesidiocoris tenuis]|uniref:Uncharacterized protein n=1 Tax=Nesidiocoris tenuis TaxID=355587 RepID=A0ABN7AYR3_9HEMI|nr:Hypothetical protein NTJ_10117 [Nesidiocoris tenuis]